MRQKSCKRCGEPFEPPTKFTYLCSDCHKAAKASGAVTDRICRQCGTTFPGGPRAWYCPDCRAERRRAGNAKRGKPARLLGSEDLCVVCGDPYIVKSSRQKYCPACAPEAVGRVVREHKRQYAADRADQIAEYKSSMSSNRHVCIICGNVFDFDRPTVTCSPDCDKIRRQRNQRAADAKRRPRRNNQ